MDKPKDFDDPNILQMNAREGDSHPEREEHETFIGYNNGSMLNAPTARNGEKLASTRKGVKVFDDYNRDRTHDADGKFFPVFVNTEELAASRQ